LNLYEQLLNINEPVTFPIPVEQNQRIHSFQGLYDVCLALILNKKVVGNDAIIKNKNLVIITGANKGGKSTFLRSIGLSQLMMQCGMFVPAESYTANICNSLFTHFRKEEDKTMESGKLDEELKRFNNMVDNINSNSLLLFDESFAATNDREGSEIAGQIVRALFEKGIKIFFVTHLFEFANNFYNKSKDIFFLQAERHPDGTRTYKLIEGHPLQTSFGKDLYHRIFEKQNL
jgi:DNA mismatch repair ATPase MutS